MLRNRLFLLLSLVGLFTAACEKEINYRGTSESIAFSADTLSFDTVFTAEATSTMRLLVYNTSKHDMLLDEIRLRGGSTSAFHVNINGTGDVVACNERLLEGDSLIIFVNVTLPETNDTEPFCTLDAIDITAGENTWSAALKAVGQNVQRIGGSVAEAEWSAGKPYYILPGAQIDTATTLTVTAGTRIFMADDATLSVYGTLQLLGSEEEPITIKGARQEAFYDDIPGQWGTIAFEIGSKNNVAQHVEIACGLYAVTVDSAAELTLNNCILRDASHGAVLAYAANVEACNCLIYNCGGSLVAAYGGQTRLIHCTLSNYFAWATRSAPTLRLISGELYPTADEFYVGNSIVVGNLSDELGLDIDADDYATKIGIYNSFLRLSTSQQQAWEEYLHDVVFGTDAGFAMRSNYDFHLQPSSPAVGIGSVDIAEEVPFDLDGIERMSDNTADAGAFEYQQVTEL